MDDKNPHTVFGRWLKRGLWFLAGLLILAVLLRLSLMTAPIHNLVKQQVEQIAGRSMNGELHIGEISGDLWKEAELRNVSVSRRDTLISIEKIYVNFRLMSLFNSSFSIPALHLEKVMINATQHQNGEWNLASLLPESDEAGDSGEAFPFNIEDLQLNGGDIRLRMPALEEDSLINIKDLLLSGAFRLEPEDFNARVEELSFDLHQGFLDGPIEFETMASISGERLSLEKLVMATGYSYFETSGTFSPSDSSLNINLRGEPVGWRDITALAETYPGRDDLDVSLELSGSREEYRMGLRVQTPGADRLHLETGVEWGDRLRIRDSRLRAQRLDLPALLGDPALPVLENPDLQLSGILDPEDYRAADLEGSLSAGAVYTEDYRLEQFRGEMTLQNGDLDVMAGAERGRETLTAEAEIDDLWGDKPAVLLLFNGSGIDPAYWAQSEEVRGEIDVTARLNGRGFALDENYWSYDFDIRGGETVFGTMERLQAAGRLNESIVETGITAEAGGNRLSLEADVEEYMENPSYRFSLSAENFDLSGFPGFEELPTVLNIFAEGEGQGTGLEDMALNSAVRIDSSVVNGQSLERFSARVQVADTILTLSDVELAGDIAEGSLEARYHLARFYDMQNRLDLDLDLRNISNFAPLAGAEILNANGPVNGSIRPVDGERLQFGGSIDLTDVRYDSLLYIPQVEGDLESDLDEEPNYLADLHLTKPVINGVVLEDLELQSNGRVTRDSTAGTLRLSFVSSSGNRIDHSGRFYLAPDSIEVLTDEFRFESPLRTLSLDRPFYTRMRGGSLEVDTLRISSGDGAYVELAVPQADSVNQRGYLEGYQLDLTELQNTLLNEAFFEGILSGRIELNRTASDLEGYADVDISELSYGGLTLDSLNLGFNLTDERLDGDLSLTDEGRHIAQGDLNVPFKTGDPAGFEESFFEESVEGSLRVVEVPLSRYEHLLEDVGFAGTNGNISFEGTLQGTAGDPVFDARMKLDNPTLSGVSLDSITTTFNYDHLRSLLYVNSSVTSLNQKAAEILAEFPLHIDMRTFEVSVPEAQELRVDLFTNGFDLAALNNFIDRTQYREVRGQMNGSVNISGTLDDLETRGDMELSDGSVRLVTAGVLLRDIEADLAFEPEAINLSNFSVRSGNGRIRGEGAVQMDNLSPSDLDFNFRAENFRAANTSDYNAIINMNTSINGTLEQPRISGNLDVVNGFVVLRNFGEESVETVELDDETGLEDYNVDLYNNLALDMNVNFNRRFFIRNRRYLEMEVELDGSLDLQKQTGEDLQLFGSLNTASGYARPLGKRFDLEEGVVTFTGDVTNPEMSIRSLYRPPQRDEEISIWYIIEGTVEDPNFRYESNPPMELENILSYTLFGQPFYMLDSWKQVVTNSGSGTGPTDMALDLVLDRVEALATQRLGIDVVEIDNTHSGRTSGTTVLTGWYLNPRVFFAIQNRIAGSTPDTGFILEYLLNSNLKLIITQGSDSREGIDLQWDLDY